jgi:hypothetical protein
MNHNVNVDDSVQKEERTRQEITAVEEATRHEPEA